MKNVLINILNVLLILTLTVYCSNTSDPTNSTPQRSSLQRLTTSAGFDIRPIWSPNGNTIAFISGRDGAASGSWTPYSIWTIPAAGGTALRLSTNISAVHQIAWSSEGSKIVYYHGSNEPEWDISVIDIASGVITRLTDDENFNMSPCFSPNGNSVVFAAYSSNNHDLVSVPVEGGELTHITSGNENDRFPSFSPDGTQIAFSSDRSGNFDIWIINLSDNSLIQLTTHSSDDFYPSWSPDGNLIAFTSGRAGNNDIWAIPSVGGTPYQLTDYTSEDEFSSWSSDGTEIVFASDRSGDWEIWIKDISEN